REAGRKGGMVSGGRRRARETGMTNPGGSEREAEAEREEGREEGEDREDERMGTMGSEGSNAPAGHGA
ncbi:MAG TPA: hypothetical protein VHO06_22500, partial [Polyangia bacterium]|nr:hypothetical protein [Polyangia bacterium]